MSKTPVLFTILALIIVSLFLGYFLVQDIISDVPADTVYQPNETFVLVGESHKKIAVGKLMVVRRADGKLLHAVLLAEREITPGTQVRLSHVVDRVWFWHEYDFLAIRDAAAPESHPAAAR